MSLEALRASLAERYAIERELGQGGMATVYLARDLKHDRQVALKVLKPELAAVLGADRFVVEIKTTAALQHPHILPLFDSGEADGFLYYVMPFIDGETLRDKLNRETQLGIDEAVRITTEVAEALHHAHSQGVVHRDIKPENILLANGRPMVADFGIALALSAAAGGRMTETGMSLGTPHYMSPEQATADKEIGPRSDVYSLASVLFEMLTGEPPHTAGSAQAIIMKIIAETAAPVTKVRKAVPPNVAAAIGKGLEKLPADRFESAKAFAEALANPGFTVAMSGTARAMASRRSSLVMWSGWGVAGLALATAAFLLLRPMTPGSDRVQRWSMTWPEGEEPAWRPDLSRDGKAIVYESLSDESTALRVKKIDELHSAVLPNTENARRPRFSHDGRDVAFVRSKFRFGSLEVTSVPPEAHHGSWSGPAWSRGWHGATTGSSTSRTLRRFDECRLIAMRCRRKS
jgi:serine/threonine-protein kinase